jgi:hypothetical protein
MRDPRTTPKKPEPRAEILHIRMTALHEVEAAAKLQPGRQPITSAFAA